MLKEWGGDEENISIKFMRYGGTIMFFRGWKVGHKFRKTPPYRLTIDKCLENSMMLAKTLCPPDVAQNLIKTLTPGVEAANAREAIRKRADEIEKERVRLDKLFTIPWDKYVRKIEEIDG